MPAAAERRRRPLIPMWSMTTEPSSTEPSPEEAALVSDERRRIHRLLGNLPELQRDAIAMRFGAEMTAREIGAVIGKSEEATQKLISRAVARLKETYREQD
jgi:RNA polymerase sigma-70 factor, ECF subfamily